MKDVPFKGALCQIAALWAGRFRDPITRPKTGRRWLRDWPYLAM